MTFAAARALQQVIYVLRQEDGFVTVLPLSDQAVRRIGSTVANWTRRLL